MKLSAYQHRLADKLATATQQTLQPRRDIRAFVAGLFLVTSVAGCSTLDPINAMRPSPTSSRTKAAQLQILENTADQGEAAYQGAVSDPDRTRLRDQVIAAKVLTNDIIFENFAWDAWGADASVATVSDWIVQGLTAAGSVATAGATQLLSATALAVTSAKTSLQKNALYSKTIDQLLYAMTVNRTQIRTHIQNCMTYPDSKYALSAALIDLEQYKQAAQLPLAIANLSTSSTSGSTQDSCATSLKIDSLAHNDTEQRVQAWVAPGGTFDNAKVQMISEWLRTKSSDPAFVGADRQLTQPWSEILKTPYQADRVRMIHDLKIP